VEAVNYEQPKHGGKLHQRQSFIELDARSRAEALAMWGTSRELFPIERIDLARDRASSSMSSVG